MATEAADIASASSTDNPEATNEAEELRGLVHEWTTTNDLGVRRLWFEIVPSQLTAGERLRKSLVCLGGRSGTGCRIRIYPSALRTHKYTAYICTAPETAAAAAAAAAARNLRQCGATCCIGSM